MADLSRRSRETQAAKADVSSDREVGG